MKNHIQHLVSMIVTILSLSFPMIAQCAQNDTVPLTVVTHCPALLDELKQATIKEMEKRIDGYLQEVLKGRNCGAIEDSIPPTISGVDKSERANEYSETNVQVVGVDEADFIKNDGSYIYILANGQFRIIDSWPPEEAREISAVDIEGIPKKLFVHEGKAFIYSSLDRVKWNAYDHWSSSSEAECTYGYDCEFTGDGHQLKITILDISQVNHPSLIREIHFSGSYLNSRRIGNAIYSVIIFPEVQISGLKYWPDKINSEPFPWCHPNNLKIPQEDIKAAFEALKLSNRNHIQSTDLREFLPSVKDIRYHNDAVSEHHEFNLCDHLYASQQQDGKNFLSIISTDINGQAPLNTVTVIGKPGAVYASKLALYIAARHWSFQDALDFAEITTVHKFSLNNENFSSQYAASGVVKGRVLNQFALDEFQGFLRIATTTGHLPDPNTHSTIYILDEQGEQLVVVGQVDKIAPTEDIRSVRFIGNQGYVVTFKKTDPLFVFNLADPYQPQMAGELKIPGFSTYMHRLDENHLLTIGYDADDQGKFAWFQGILLQIFDVTDMTQPTLTHKEVIGTRGSTSEAATNHLAFNYFSSKGLLAIPMTICERDGQEEGGSRYGDLMKFSGLLVYHVDAETGFDRLGGVPHVAPENRGTSRNWCSNWWTRSNSYVKRSIFMEDYVFSITEDTIKVNKLITMGQDVAVVYLTEQPACDPLHIGLCDTESTCLSNSGEWVEGRCRLPRYLPKRSMALSKDLCTASYDSITNLLIIPCVVIENHRYRAQFSSLTISASRSQLKLDSIEQPETRMSSQKCEVTYVPSEEIVHIPCLVIDEIQYGANFKVLKETPFTIQLTELGVIRE